MSCVLPVGWVGCRGSPSGGVLNRCSKVDPGSLASMVRAKLGSDPQLARFAGSLERLLSLLCGLSNELGAVGAVFFGSLVDPERMPRRESDIDVVVIAERGDAHEALARAVPEVVRLKRLPSGEIDAHTQLLDVEWGVLWHVITARPGREGEKLGLIEGPCFLVEPCSH